MNERALAMDLVISRELLPTLHAFLSWVNAFGETSLDHQSFFAGRFGRSAKALYYRRPHLGTVAVAPMIFCEAFIPTARWLFWRKQRFPIADAHYAMGLALLAKATGESRYYDRAVQFLKVLEDTRCKDFRHFCWGYPFDWVTRTGTLSRGTPLITTTPYVYEAFSHVHELDGQQHWLDVMESIAEHAMHDIKDRELSEDCATAGYTPFDREGGVVNASAYRAFLLTHAAIVFSKKDYKYAAERNVNYVLRAQQADGSWFYATDGVRNFIDHFHTCFVLKALAKIEGIAGSGDCRRAIEKGVAYYVHQLFDKEGLPKPFAKAPRVTLYKRELYDYAECINLGLLVRGRFLMLDDRLEATLGDLFARWRKPDGSFRSRRLALGWDNVPMHRWAQAQLFRSLCFLLWTVSKEAEGESYSLAPAPMPTRSLERAPS